MGAKCEPRTERYQRTKYISAECPIHLSRINEPDVASSSFLKPYRFSGHHGTVTLNRLLRQERKRALELQPDDWT